VQVLLSQLISADCAFIGPDIDIESETDGSVRRETLSVDWRLRRPLAYRDVEEPSEIPRHFKIESR